MTAVFVTAIGTECGKTHVSCAVLRRLVAQGRSPLAIKPLMSGYSPDALETSDAGRLLAALGRAATASTIQDICWKFFPEWSAPNVAARRAGVQLSYGELIEFVCERLGRHAGPALVEGAGGVMSPLTDTHTNLDLIGDLGLPVVLMASNYLGAVSHTLTALEVLAQRRLETKAIVVTETVPNAGPAQSLIDELERWTSFPLLRAAFARTEEDDLPVAAELVRRLFP